jgi:hypothetical protein
LLASLCGCTGLDSKPSAPSGPAARLIHVADRPDQPVNDRDYLLFVQIRLGVIELPAGTISNSEDIWSYLDEEAVDANRSAGLGRNGLRAGVGRPDVWPDLERILKRMAGREVSYRTIAMLPGEAGPLVLKPNQDEQSIFTFRADRTLSGSLFPPGDDLLTLSCSLDQDDPGTIHIMALPQIRTTATHVGVLDNPTGPALAPVRDLYSFDELAFRCVVAGKGILVVGPGQRSADSYSLGRQFLTIERDGVRYEMLLVMIPEVLATPRKPR